MKTENVLTLACRLAGEVKPDEVEAAAAEAARGLRQQGATVESPFWLAPGIACDLFFDNLDSAVAETHVRETLAGSAIDLAAQPVAGRRKQLLIADMESTVIGNEMLDELADFAGVRSEVEDITARAMAGEIDFGGAMRQRVGLLEGLPASVIEEAMLRIEIDPGAAQLVATLSAHGVTTALVSGGFGVFAQAVQRRLGFDSFRANELLVEDGRLTGRVGEPILGRDAKVEALQDLCRQLDLSPEDVATVGDGANDLGMLLASGFGVAYHAKPAVITAARFSVRYGDLRTLLFYQGYGEHELSA